VEEDDAMAVWWSTPAECWSALARLRREEVITLGGETAAHRVLDALRENWLEVLPSEPVRETSKRLLRNHVLRAADALQLAAALVWSGGMPGRELVTFDERLLVAAELEGFQVLRPKAGRTARVRKR
jgi:predicted nucleic acid-binding protein